MLKEICIVSFVIVTVLICNFLFQIYIVKSSDSLVDKLGILSEKVKSNSDNMKDNNDIEKLLNDIDNEWEKDKKVWTIFVMHNELDEIEIAFTNIKTSIDVDYKEDAVIETEKARFLLQHIAERDSFELKNLF